MTKKSPLVCQLGMAGINFKHNRIDLCYRSVDGTETKHTTFEDALNDEVLNKQRLSLLQGEWPETACDDCKIMERMGAKSYRERIKFEPEKDEQWFLDNVDPVTGKMEKLLRVEFRFNNTCNYACRHCSAEYSTAWTKIMRNNPDLQKFHGINTLTHETSYAQFLDLDSLIPYVNKLNGVDEFLELEITGGEPFFQKEFYECLKKLRRCAHKIHLLVTTNGSISTKFKDYDVIDLLKPFKTKAFKISIDGSKSFYSYFRQGGDWDNVISNIKNFKRHFPGSPVSPVISVSNMQAARLKEIYEDFKTISRPEYYSMCEVIWPDMINPRNFPQELKDRYLSEWIEFVETLPMEERKHAHHVGDFTVAMLSSKEREQSKWEEFCKYTDRLDRVHNKNVFDYFPEWEEYWVR